MAAPAPRSLAGVQSALRSGGKTALDLLEETLTDIAASDTGAAPLNAFLAVGGDAVRRDAEAVDRALTAGREPGSLAGVPVAVKDNICTTDLPTTCGSRMLEDYVSPFEATVLRRLREAGVLIVGKTNMDEFAMGSSTENSAFGPTRNPLDRGRVPGGSSGGSAAAVAADLVPLALGSDTGGSVRQPASFCGVVGIRPTWGRVSRYGLVAFASSLDQIGGFARSVREVWTLLTTIAGPDRFDSTSVAQPALPSIDELWDREADAARGLVVGFPLEYLPEDLEPGVRAAVQAAAARFVELGAEVREISLPSTDLAIPTYYLIASAEVSSNLARYDGVRYGYRAPDPESTDAVYRRTRGSGFGPEVKRRILLGTYGLSAGYHDQYYGRALSVRREIAREFESAFAGGIDVIFTPTAPTVAFPLGARLDRPVEMYEADIFTVPPSLAGIPALSMPIGTAGGLPVGGQLVGRRFDEATIVRAGYALECSIRAEPLRSEG